uniref:KxDL domain-containing protein n=1 Tax=Strigamia maritima TaxID=126957 RepID=T1JII3_STRMM
MAAIDERKAISAPEILVDSLAGQVNQSDIDTILQSQRLMLTRFEKTNEMLLNCNALTAARFSAAQQEFRRHTQQLVEMKKDLESVFRRIRFAKKNGNSVII